MKILLIQARNIEDGMGAHEIHCIRARLSSTSAELVTRNALTERACADWLQGMDGLIIGGSGAYSVHHPDSQQWVNPMRDVIEVALTTQLPSFGLCFGHQLLGMHLGAQVVTDPTCEEVGTVTVELTESGAAHALFDGFPSAFPCHTGHSDHVVSTPESVDLLVTSPRTLCQAFQVRGAPFFSTQFHPDLLGAEAQARYLANKRGPDGRPDAVSLSNAQAYRPGDDVSTSLLARFVETWM